MTLSQIMTLALRQLDEDVQDIGEYEDAFRVYANIGYGIAVREFLSPKEWFTLVTDERGMADIPCERVIRVVETRDRESGRELASALTTDGRHLMLREKNKAIGVLCEVNYPEMKQPTDEPMLPVSVHYALADYICYRHLSSGSMAKQSRAEFFLRSFYAAMKMLRPQGMSAVKDYKNLYVVTDIRYAR